MTNRPINTGSLSNKSLGSSDMDWDSATFTWNEAMGTWDNPYSIANKALNTASLTNKAIS